MKSYIEEGAIPQYDLSEFDNPLVVLVPYPAPGSGVGRIGHRRSVIQGNRVKQRASQLLLSLRAEGEAVFGGFRANARWRWLGRIKSGHRFAPRNDRGMVVRPASTVHPIALVSHTPAGDDTTAMRHIAGVTDTQ